MSTTPLAESRSRVQSRHRAGALLRGLGLALAPILLFVSIPIGLSGGFVLAWGLLAASLVLVTLDVTLFGAPSR